MDKDEYIFLVIAMMVGWTLGKIASHWWGIFTLPITGIIVWLIYKSVRESKS